MSHSEKKLSLNPFAFPTETDGQFLLLLFVVGGSTFSIVRQLLGVYTKISNELLLSFISLGATLFVFLWAHLRASRIAENESNRAGWQKLSTVEAIPSEQQSFDSFLAHLHEIRNCLPDVPKNRLCFLWSGKNRAVTGKAFGYRKKQFLLLRRGVFEAFIINLKTFETVLLHELSHIANRDVSKTTFSIQLGKCFNKVAVVITVFLNLFVFFHIARRLSANLSLTPLWDGIFLFGEINVKIVLLFLFVEVTRSSVLRVREYYADKRTAVWLGSANTMIEQIQRVAKARKNTGTYSWEGVKQQFRQRLAPLHPTNQQRVSALRNLLYLFEPRRATAILSGMLVGLSISSNSGWVIEILNQSIILITTLDTVTANSNNLLYVTFIFIFGFILFFIGLLIVMVIFGLLGAFPVAVTVGLQVQKAAFADQLLSKRNHLLPGSKLIEQSILLSIALIVGLFMNPTPNPVNIGTLAIGHPALLLSPIYALGWMVVFLLWLLPISWMAGRLYLSHRTKQPPSKNYRSLTTLSIFALIPIFNAMSWTHVIFSSLYGLPENLPGSEERLVGIAFVIAAWALSLILYGIVWAWGYYWLKRKKWLTVDVSHHSPPVWSVAPPRINLPKPLLIKIGVQNTPPPL